MMMTAELNPKQVIPYPGRPLSPHLLKMITRLLLHTNWLRTLMLEGQLKRRSRQAPTGVNERQQPHDLLWNYDDNMAGTIKRQQTNTHRRPKVVDSFFFFSHPPIYRSKNKQEKGQIVGLGENETTRAKTPRNVAVTQPVVFLLPLNLFVIKSQDERWERLPNADRQDGVNGTTPRLRAIDKRQILISGSRKRSDKGLENEPDQEDDFLFSSFLILHRRPPERVMIRELGNAGGRGADHRSLPRTFFIISSRRRQDHDHRHHYKATHFSMRPVRAPALRVHLKLQRISAFSRKNNKIIIKKKIPPRPPILPDNFSSNSCNRTRVYTVDKEEMKRIDLDTTYPAANELFEPISLRPGCGPGGWIRFEVWDTKSREDESLSFRGENDQIITRLSSASRPARKQHIALDRCNVAVSV